MSRACRPPITSTPPTLAQDRGSDIADVWAFLDPNASRISVRKANNPNGGFANMGGRRLVDGVFTLINNGILLTDFVNGNEVPFRNVFPFIADPTQPFPPGQDPDDHTRQ